MGVRWNWRFADGWSLIARGDIGGFGLGSEFSWHALGLVEWHYGNMHRLLLAIELLTSTTRMEVVKIILNLMQRSMALLLVSISSGKAVYNIYMIPNHNGGISSV